MYIAKIEKKYMAYYNNNIILTMSNAAHDNLNFTKNTKYIEYAQS